MNQVIGLKEIIDKSEYKIYGADAEMVYPVLKSGVLYELLEHSMKKECIKNLMYKSLSDNEKVSYVAASQLSTEILKKVVGIDLSSLYDKLKEYENTGEFYPAYREHVIHQWRVFILGLYLLEKIEIFKNRFEEKFHSEYVKVWAATALCHDIGYLIERGDVSTNTFAKDIMDLINDLDRDGFIAYCPEFNMQGLLSAQKAEIKRRAGISVYELDDWTQLFYDRDNKNCWKLECIDNDDMKFENFYNMASHLKTKAENRPCFIDHGIASAAILFNLLEKKKYWTKRVCQLDEYSCKDIKHLAEEDVVQVCRAIALHNIRPDLWDQDIVYIQYHMALNSFKILFNNELLASLLVLCDSLQEWNRPSKVFEKKFRNEMTSQDIHIMCKDNVIYLCFPTDELAGSKSKDSAYHRMIGPIERLLDIEDCVRIVEIEDDKMGKYVDSNLLQSAYKISTGSKRGNAFELYKQGREYGNSTRWEEGKRLHVEAAKLFQEEEMNDWVARSLGRAAFDALDLCQIRQADELLNRAMESDLWQGTANYYWGLEHCIRNDQKIEIMIKYFHQMLSGMQKLQIIDAKFVNDFEGLDYEKRFNILWDKLILFFASLIQKESNWPEWAQSDQPRQFVLMAERYTEESIGYLELAEEMYRSVKLNSYAAWTKSKRLFLKAGYCKSIDEAINLLSQILEEERGILQTPGGPRDIVRFTIKLNSFFLNVLRYIFFKEEEYKSEAKVYFSAIDTFKVSTKFEYKELCDSILTQLSLGNVNEIELLTCIKDSVVSLAWLEKRRMCILLR